MCFGFCRLESWLDEADDQADAVRPARTLVTKTHPNPKPHRQEKFVSKRPKVPGEESRQQAVGKLRCCGCGGRYGAIPLLGLVMQLRGLAWARKWRLNDEVWLM